MPNIKSKIKNVRRIEKQRAYNRAIKSRIHTAGKAIQKILSGEKQDKTDLQKKLSSFFKTIDKAERRNVMKKNTVARRKSYFAKLISSLK